MSNPERLTWKSNRKNARVKQYLNPDKHYPAFYVSNGNNSKAVAFLIK